MAQSLFFSNKRLTVASSEISRNFKKIKQQFSAIPFYCLKQSTFATFSFLPLQSFPQENPYISRSNGFDHTGQKEENKTAIDGSSPRHSGAPF